METLAHPRLQRRAGGWYARAKVPAPLRPVIGKTEVVRSLRTTNHRLAVERLRAASAEIDQQFREAQRRLRPVQPVASRPATEEDVRSMVRRWFAGEARINDHDHDDVPALLLIIDHDLAIVSDPHDTNARASADAIARRLLSEHGLTADGRTLALALDLVQRGLAEGLRQRRARALGDHSARVADQAFADATPHEAPSTRLSWSVAAQKFATERSSTWTPKTKADRLASLALFQTITGDLAVADITRAHVTAFKDVLLRLPANYTKLRQLRGLAPAAAADKAAQLGLRPMSAATLNKSIETVSSFLAWASDNGHRVGNPAVRLKVRTGKRAMDEWSPFTAAHLNAIFRSPTFTGYRSARHWQEPGTLIDRHSGRFWMPLLGLLTGARMSELAQLAVVDVEEDGGIAVLLIRPDPSGEKSVKTASSRRVIPVHQTLVALGFMDHVRWQRDRAATRLFPDLERGADGYYSSVYSKHFARLLRSLGIKAPRLSFHSLRHSFKDAARAAGIEDVLSKALQGHVDPSMSGRYGSGFPVPVLAGAINRIQPPVDLSHLRR